MELELLEGIFDRIGQMYAGRRVRAIPSSSAINIPTNDKEVETLTRAGLTGFLERRNQICLERAQMIKQKTIREENATDSGYSSIIESGHSSHQGSKSPSPLPLPAAADEIMKQESDPRERMLLVCQAGVLPVRIVNQDEEVEQECEEDILEADIGRQPNQVKPNIKMHCRSRVSWSSSQDKDGRIFYRGDKVHKDKTLEGSGHPGENKVEKSSEHLGENKVEKSSGHPGENKVDKSSEHPGENKVDKSSGHPGENKVEKSSGHTGENKVDKSSEHLGESKAEQKFVFANGSGHPGEKRKENLVDVQLEGSGEIIRVDLKYLEPAGRPDQDKVADLTTLQVLNESSLVWTLSSRFQAAQYQTKLGKSTVSLNPMRRTDSGCGRTARKRRKGGGEGDPLLEQVELMYRRAVLSQKTQSLVLVGRSGAGKSCNLKQSLAYLVQTTLNPQHKQARFTLERMHAVDCLMESFCSTRTSLNTHATRLVQLTELGFDEKGWLQGAAIEMALPDTNRLLRSGRLKGEPTFPILYQVTAALDKSNLFLPPRLLSNNSFFTPLQDEVEVLTALEDWERVCGAMELLLFTQEEQDSFWIILAAITNLGHIAQQLESGDLLPEPAGLEKVATLLGVKAEDLRLVISRSNTPRTISPATSIVTSSASSRTSSPSPVSHSSETSFVGVEPLPDSSALGAENVRRLSVSLYAELLSRLVSYINRAIKPASSQPANILLFDSPGFQNPSTTGDRPCAGFVELCYNYLQEKIQDIFNKQCIHDLPRGKEAAKFMFAQRGTPGPILNLIDRQSNKTVRRASSKQVGRESKRVRFERAAPGLLSLLHRAGNCPWSDDQVFLHRLIAHWGSPGGGGLVERVGEHEFVLQHCLGTNPVKYSVQGWRHMSYSMGRTNLALELLRKSKRVCVFGDRPSLMYRGLGQPPLSLQEVKARMSCLQVQVQVETIVELLQKTEMSFVFCLVPHHLAGLCELFKKSPGRYSNQKLIRDQVRGYQLLDYLTALRSNPQADLAGGSVDLGGCVCKAEVVGAGPGLAEELWHGLQLAVVNALTNIQAVEAAFSSLTRSVSLPSQPVSQALDESGFLILEGGKLSLNLEGFVDAGL